MEFRLDAESANEFVNFSGTVVIDLGQTDGVVIARAEIFAQSIAGDASPSEFRMMVSADWPESDANEIQKVDGTELVAMFSPSDGRLIEVRLEGMDKYSDDRVVSNVISRAELVSAGLL